MKYLITVLLFFSLLQATSSKVDTIYYYAELIPDVKDKWEVMDSILISNTVYSKRSIAWRYKNPGNLRDFKTGEYRQFSSVKLGYEAMSKQIDLYVSGRSMWTDSTTTLNEFIYKTYANETTNPNYIRTLTKNLNVKSTVCINTLNVDSLQKYLIFFEDNKLYKILYPNT